MMQKSMYAQEFRLLSSKFAIRLEDLTPQEIGYYKICVAKDYDMPEDEIKDEMLFDTDEEIGTEELRVRYWDWAGHEIIDINTWPGDNESGVIILDGVIIAVNGDQDLELLENVENEFEKYINLFEAIRILTIYSVEELNKLNNSNFTPEAMSWACGGAGRAAYKIEIAAQEAFVKQSN